MPRKETRRKERRKNGSGHRAKPSSHTQATDARMGKEEKKRKQKEEQNKETGSGTQLPGPFGRPLRPAWIIQWANTETPPPTGGLLLLFGEYLEAGSTPGTI